MLMAIQNMQDRIWVELRKRRTLFVIAGPATLSSFPPSAKKNQPPGHKKCKIAACPFRVSRCFNSIALDATPAMICLLSHRHVHRRLRTPYALPTSQPWGVPQGWRVRFPEASSDEGRPHGEFNLGLNDHSAKPSAKKAWCLNGSLVDAAD